MVLRQTLGQIRPNIVKKVKKQAISLGFFHVLLGDYLLKQEAVVAKPPLVEIYGNYGSIARNVKF